MSNERDKDKVQYTLPRPPSPPPHFQPRPAVQSPTPRRITNQQNELPMPGPFDHNMLHVMSEVLRNIVLPQCPPMYSPTAAQSTMDPFRSQARREDKYDEDPSEATGYKRKVFPRLDKVVYHPSLLDSLLTPAIALLENLSLNLREPQHLMWLSKIHPEWTAVDLPGELGSERDTEKYVASVILHPAIRCLQALNAGSSIQCSYDQKAFSCTSGRGAEYPITDALIFWKGTVRATVEIKTHHAFKSTGLRSTQIGTFQSLTDVPGLTMKYYYPNLGDGKRKQTVSSQAKILVQVWEQMHGSRVDFAILTSYEQIVFFFKNPASDTMYMSRCYRRNDSPLLHVFAFLACATGLVDRNSLKLIDSNTSWWSDDVLQNKGNYAGIHPRSLPAVYMQLQSAKPSRSTTAERVQPSRGAKHIVRRA